MRFVVDGAARKTLTAAEARQAEPVDKVYAGSGKVLSPAVAARQGWLGCLILIAIFTALVWAVFLINVLFGDPQIDYSGLRLFIALVGLIGPVVLFSLAPLVAAKSRSQAAADYAEAPPPGTRIGVDETGLSVGDQRFSWDEIALDRLELDTSHTEDDAFLRPRSLLLVTPAGAVLISHRVLEDGFWIVREIHRRLWPQVLAELGRDDGANKT